jgi:hypothetical protein
VVACLVVVERPRFMDDAAPQDPRREFVAVVVQLLLEALLRKIGMPEVYATGIVELELDEAQAEPVRRRARGAQRFEVDAGMNLGVRIGHVTSPRVVR